MIRSLHGKLIIFSSMVGVLILVIAGYFVLQERQDKMESFNIRVFSGHVDLIIETFSAEMAVGGMDSVRTILTRHAKNPDISDIKLFDRFGKVVISASGSEGQIDSSLVGIDSLFRSESRYARRKGKLLSIIKSIGNSDNCYGCHPSEAKVLGYLETDFLSVPTAGDSHGFYSLLIGAGVLFIILLSASLWLSQHLFIRRPLASLMAAIENAKSGDLGSQAKVFGSDEISRLIESFNELTARLDKAQQELKGLHQKNMEKAERLATVGELASGIAHEIKNPLAGISSIIQVMLDNESKEFINKDILVEMEIQIRRIDRAVKDLLAYACPRAPEFKTGNLNESVKRCASFMLPIAERQGTSLETNFDQDIPSTLLDSALIDQVMVNILMNAFQALKSDGTVSVSSKYNADEHICEVIISDDGPGMPSEIVEQVFRPFYTTKHKGSGLGLSICKKNVERHCGTIEVQSEPGKGARFVMRFPLNMTFEQLLDKERQ